MNTFSNTQRKLGQTFRDLHFANEGFIIPNPWDAGTAKFLEQLGFKSLATTSAGFSFARGRQDKSLSLGLVLGNLRQITEATSLPVSADLENGFGDSPEKVANAIFLAAEAGVVGGSIEDSTGRSDEPLYEIAHAKDRIRAAVDAARSLPFPFTLTARAENYFLGQKNLSDTISRLQAYQEAGADVLYAPGLTRAEDIRTVLAEVDRPLNVLIGFPGISLNVNELTSMGVKRVSVGGSLARAAWGGFSKAAAELMEHGSAEYIHDAISGKQLNEMMK